MVKARQLIYCSDVRQIVVRFPGETKQRYLLQNLQTGSGALPNSYSRVRRVAFLEVKMAEA
jgi:hypothetical protein